MIIKSTCSSCGSDDLVTFVKCANCGKKLQLNTADFILGPRGSSFYKMPICASCIASIPGPSEVKNGGQKGL